jgi:hypothetical protein
MHHVELARRRTDDARRRLELRDGQLRLPVGALFERQLVLEPGEANLAVGQEGLRDDDGEQRRHDQRHRHDVEHSPPVRYRAIHRPRAPLLARPGRDDP